MGKGRSSSGERGSGFLETAIINFTSRLLSYYLVDLPADWKVLYHLLFFTHVFSFFRFIQRFFNSLILLIAVKSYINNIKS